MSSGTTGMAPNGKHYLRICCIVSSELVCLWESEVVIRGYMLRLRRPQNEVGPGAGTGAPGNGLASTLSTPVGLQTMRKEVGGFLVF